MAKSTCYDDGLRHRYFVAETVGVPEEGTVTIVAICTECGDFLDHTVLVSKNRGASQLLGTDSKRKKSGL